MTAIDTRCMTFGDLPDFRQSAASQCRSITELHGIYYHLCYVSFDEQRPRRFLNVNASPQQGMSFCLGTIHIDRIGNAIHQELADDRSIVQPFSQVHQGQYYHSLELPEGRLRLPNVQYNVTFYQQGREPVSFVLNKDADIATVQTVLFEYLRTAGIASLGNQTHFAQQYSLSDMTLLYSLERQSIDQIYVFEYYPLTQPTVDSCTRLCFGYYTVARIVDRSSPQSVSATSLQEPISSTRLSQSSNVRFGRNNRSANTRVNFRREQYPSRSSTQPRRRVTFKCIYDLHSAGFFFSYS